MDNISTEQRFRWLSFDELKRHEADWRDLAQTADMPNPYYGPGLFTAFAETRGLPGNLEIASVWTDAGGAQRLDGLAFYTRDDFRWGLPIRTWVTFQSKYLYSTGPLLRAGCRTSALRTLYDRLSDNRSRPTLLLSLEQTGTPEQPLQLTDESPERQKLRDHQAVIDSCQRAALLPEWDEDTYVRTGPTRKSRQNVRRSIRKLDNMGELRFETVTQGEGLGQAVADFILLESCGWKAEQGSALASDPRDIRFATEAFANGDDCNASCDVLSLDGRPIAINLNLVSGGCLFGYKSTFDESYKQYSPGAVLHFMAAAAIHRSGELRLADSTTDDTHPINSIWPQRIAAGTLLSSVGAHVSTRRFNRYVNAEQLRTNLRKRGVDLYHRLTGKKVVGKKQT